MPLTLETSTQPDGIVAWVAGDPGKLIVARIKRVPRRRDGAIWLAEAFGIGRQAAFASLPAAEYWLLAMVIEYEARRALENALA